MRVSHARPSGRSATPEKPTLEETSVVKKKGEEPKIVGAGIVGATGAMIGAAVGGPVGAVVGAGMSALIGHWAKGDLRNA